MERFIPPHRRSHKPRCRAPASQPGFSTLNLSIPPQGWQTRRWLSRARPMARQIQKPQIPEPQWQPEFRSLPPRFPRSISNPPVRLRKITPNRTRLNRNQKRRLSKPQMEQTNNSQQKPVAGSAPEERQIGRDSIATGESGGCRNEQINNSQQKPVAGSAQGNAAPLILAEQSGQASSGQSSSGNASSGNASSGNALDFEKDAKHAQAARRRLTHRK